VADRRFDDAQYLRRSKKNKYANGAMYLGGLVLDILLKAKLLEEHPWLQNPPGDLARRPASERRLHALCYREHDLIGILDRLSRRTLDRLDSAGLLKTLKKLCGTWTIHVRYSPRTSEISEAADFLNRVREVREWLK